MRRARLPWIYGDDIDPPEQREVERRCEECGCPTTYGALCQDCVDLPYMWDVDLYDDEGEQDEG